MPPSRHVDRCRTPQPSARSASSITRVSSESSRSWTRVVPALSAASSSTRLEMLLEPGRRTVPAARAAAAEVQEGGGEHGRRVFWPMRQCGAGWLASASRRALLACASGPRAVAVASLISMLASSAALEHLGLLQQLLAVGHQDVAPHLRVAGRDAGEVAEARAGQRRGSPCPAAGSRWR